jgi:carboxypeptidase family protein
MHRLLALSTAVVGVSILSCAGVRQLRVDPVTSCATGEMSRLTVYVVDQTGAYLPGATVTLLDPAGGTAERLDTDRHGVAAFTRLPRTGVCALRGELTGFEVTVARAFPCAPQCHTAVTVRMRVDMRNAVTFT